MNHAPPFSAFCELTGAPFKDACQGTLSAREGECKRLQAAPRVVQSRPLRLQRRALNCGIDPRREDKIGDAVGQHEELRTLAHVILWLSAEVGPHPKRNYCIEDLTKKMEGDCRQALSRPGPASALQPKQRLRVLCSIEPLCSAYDCLFKQC